MYDSPVALQERAAAGALDGVRIGWSVVVARDARPVGFRLVLAPQSGVPPATMSAVLDEVLAAFTGDGTPGFPHGLVLIAPHGFAPDEGLLRFSPPRNVLLEVAQEVLADEQATQLLYEVQRHGTRLALRVDGAGLPHERLGLFQYLIDAVGGAKPRADVALIATGATTRAQAEAAFKQGASAVLGWPHEPAAPGTGLQPQQRAVLELIRMVQADADLRDLERAFKAEPLLAYLLLTLANSPAFVRSSPIASLSQAIGLLGYKRLVKWLVLLLVIASKSSRSLPAIYGAVARGFAMEGLAAAAGQPTSARDECFVVGVFSLLDRVTGQPLAALIGDNALPPAVSDALLGGVGPYAGFLALAAQLDGLGNGGDAQTPLVLAPAAINGALLHALSSNDALQSVV